MTTTIVTLPWAQFDHREPRRAPDREKDRCNPGHPTDPSRWCRWHDHQWCETCKGFYGVPHDGIHGQDGTTAHPEGSGFGPNQCACRPCRTYWAMTPDARLSAYVAYDLAQLATTAEEQK